MTMEECMTSKPTCIGPRDTLASARALMDAEGFRRLPVIENSRLIGILSDRDIRSHAGYLDSTLVDAAMTSDVVTVDVEAPLEDAVRLMLCRKIGGVPVVDRDRVVGIVTSTDILKAFLQLRRDMAREKNGAAYANRKV